MASVGISALGRTSTQFVEPEVKVNDDYYRNVLLRQGLLLEMREQKNASACFLEHGEFRWFVGHSCMFHKVM